VHRGIPRVCPPIEANRLFARTILTAIAAGIACSIACASEAGARYAPGELLVKFRATSNRAARSEIESGVHASTIHTFDSGLERIRLSDGASVEDAARALSGNPLVEYAEPNYEVHALGLPNDPRFVESWALHNTGQSGGTPGADIRAVDAWDVSTGDSTLLIGVIDSGVDYYHPDLIDNMWFNKAEAAGFPGVDDDGNGYVDDVHGWDFYNSDPDPMDEFGHGTAVAGVIAARGNNGVGTAGVAWRARIVPLGFISGTGLSWVGNVIQAIEYSVRVGCRITNNSWSIGATNSQALLDAITAAGASGQLFVAAAGNSATNIDQIQDYPSSYDSPYILSVAATDARDELAGFSNFGPFTVSVAAPGEGILTTLASSHGGGYASASGTSFAAPFATGVAALVMSRHPELSPIQVKDLIVQTAARRPGLDGRVEGGRLDAFAALEDHDDQPPGRVTDLIGQAADTASVILTWTAPGDDGSSGRASLYDVRYSSAPIAPENFVAATPVPSRPPLLAGLRERLRVSGLHSSTDYYFAMRAIDELGNLGPIGDAARVPTLGRPIAVVTPTFLDLTTQDDSAGTVHVTIRNAGTDHLEWTLGVPRDPRSGQTDPEAIAGAAWIKISPSTGTLGPGNSTDVAVHLDPTGLTAETHLVVLALTSNDPEHGSIQVRTRITLTRSSFIQAPAALAFDTTAVGGVRTIAMPVTNLGDFYFSLQIGSLTSTNRSFVVDAITNAIPISSGSTAYIPVRFSPTAPCAPCTGELLIHSNDPSNRTLRVSLSGVAAPPPVLGVGVDSVRVALANGIIPEAASKTAFVDLHNTGGMPLHYRCYPRRASQAAIVAADPSGGGAEPEGLGPGRRGGPDRFGYTFVDSAEPDGPQYDWVDVFTKSARYYFARDSVAQNVPIGFSFPFYGRTFKTVNISAYGWLSFTDVLPRGAGYVMRLPNPATAHNMLAAHWGIIFPPAVNYYNDGTRFIVTYPRAQPLNFPPIRFQVILYPDGRIVYQYANTYTLVHATVGIQNGAGDDGLTAFYNTDVYGLYAIEFRPPALWLRPAIGEGIVPAGETVAIPIELNASGLVDGSYTAALTIESDDPAHASIDVPVNLHVGVDRGSLEIDPDHAPGGTSGRVMGHLLPPGDCLVSGIGYASIGPAGAPTPSKPDSISTAGCEAVIAFDRLKFLSSLPSGPSVTLQCVAEEVGVTWFTAPDTISMLRPTIALPAGPYAGGAAVPLSLTPAPGAPPSHYQFWFSPDSGRSWSAASVSASGGDYAWTPPSSTTTQGLLEAVAHADSDGSYVGSGFSGPLRIDAPGRPSAAIEALPRALDLRIVSANPAHGEVRMELAMPEPGRVEMIVLDVRGAVVQRLADRDFEAGRHALVWDSAAMSTRHPGPGIYFVRLRAAGRTITRRLALVP
jgi:subtilisin family serine protease